VLKVLNTKRNDRTPVISLLVLKNWPWKSGTFDSKLRCERVRMDERELIICRCEEVSQGEMLIRLRGARTADGT